MPLVRALLLLIALLSSAMAESGSAIAAQRAAQRKLAQQAIDTLESAGKAANS